MIKNFLHIFQNKNEKIVRARLSSAFQKVQMDDAAKARTRALLQEYMEMQPIRTGAPVQTAHLSLFSSMVSITGRGYAVPITAVVLIFGLTAGTAFAAEGALPGDTLYPIKVHITEEARGILATTPKAQAEWEIERTSRRLEEASTLAVEGNLTSANQAEIETNLAEHVAATARKAQILADNKEYTDASDVGAELHAVLKAHGDILASVLPAVGGADDPTDGHSLISDVATHLNSAAAISAHSDTIESTATTDNTVLRRKDIALNEISTLRSYIEQKKADGSAPELIDRADAELQKAEVSFTDAMKDQEEGAIASAFLRFSTARNTALDTKASLSAQTRLLNISLRLAQTNNDEHPDEIVAAKAAAPQMKTTSLKPQPMRAANATTSSKESSETHASRSAVIDSVIGVLLHGSDDTSKTDRSGKNTFNNSTEMRNSSEGTEEDHDTKDQFEHDLKSSVPLGL